MKPVPLGNFPLIHYEWDYGECQMEALKVVGLVADWIKEIAEMAGRGVSKEDIIERLKDPSSPGAQLIEAVQDRRKTADDIMGRS